MRAPTILCSAVLLACSPTPTEAPVPRPTAVPSPAPVAPPEECSARFAVLQKDAYRDTPGRTALWPPHTTTTLDVSCPSGASTEVHDNHGTKPQDKDAAGQLLLDEVKGVDLTGTKEELTALSLRYRACSCATRFLSLDALSDEAVVAVLAELQAYAKVHLRCPSKTAGADAMKQLSQGDVAAMTKTLTACTWNDSHTWQTAFDAATTKFASSANKALADYHVCNNDARLQVELIQAFAAGDKAAECDVSSEICAGPLWFYSP